MPDPPEPKKYNTLAPIHNSKFFFEDSMVVIQVENVRFKVHKSKLLESETFTDMFVVATGLNTGNKPMEGSSVDNPIKLEGVSAFDFECLLTLLYARQCTLQPTKLYIPLILPAFRLVHMWNFKELREYLIPLPEKGLNDVDKIVYAHEFAIEEWIIPAYIRLSCRVEPLNSEEAEKIGLKSVMLIFRLRETKGCQSCKGNSLARQPAMTTYRCANGHGWDTSGVAAAAAQRNMTEAIKYWQKNGQVFS